jgi:integrase
MSTGALAAVPSLPGTGTGYWQRLDSAVRPEFRVDLYRPPQDDPILRKQRCCAVPGCRLTLDPDDSYCKRHDKQWRDMGQPEPAEFLAVIPPTTPVRISGGRVCAVEHCANPVFARRWCRPHDQMWQRRQCPDGFERTAATVRQVLPCRVRHCGRPEAVIVYGLCAAHRRHWKEAGEPPLDAFIEGAQRVRNIETAYSVVGMPPGPKLELQFLLQQRRDAVGARLRADAFLTIVEAVRSEGDSCGSLLERPLAHWEGLLLAASHSAPGRNGSGIQLGFLRWAYAELELLVEDDPWESDVWYSRRIRPGHDTHVRAIDWSRIPQQWLRDAAKRWGRLRATTLTLGVVSNDARRLARFGEYLASETTVRWPRDLTRPKLEAYLARIAVELPADERYGTLSSLRMFLVDAAEFGMLDLRPDVRVRRIDYPRRPEALPRFLPEPVMAVLERPESLALLADNGLRNLVQVLIGTGRRAKELLRLPTNCVEAGPDGDPYLRFYSGKMAREDMIPIDPATAAAIAAQQALVLRMWPEGSPWLFPRPKVNPLGAYPFGLSTLNRGLNRWAEALDLRAPLPPAAPPGSVAPLVNLTAHRFRHTIATRMINEDVPQYVIQRFLGHESAQMTQRYAAIHDKTLSEAFKRYRHRVTSEGEVVVYQPDSPMGQGMKLTERLKRARQTLANGYCGRPVQTDCIHPNFCIGCTQYVADVTFLPVLRGQRSRATTMEATCIDEGRTRWAERNRKDIVALDVIIDALEELPEAADFAP